MSNTLHKGITAVQRLYRVNASYLHIPPLCLFIMGSCFEPNHKKSEDFGMLLCKVV